MREPVQKLVERYQQNLYAAAFNVCKNQMDAEDIVQEAFLQYSTSKKEFEDEQHIRAWLIRVVINKAKNCNLTFWRRNKCSLDDYIETLVFETPQSRELFEEVMKLPEKYRIVIHLFYYEGLSTRQIASVLDRSEATIRSDLHRGREQLKRILKEAYDFEV